MNESYLVQFASIATILDLLLGIYVLIADRPKREQLQINGARLPVLTAGVRVSIVFLSAFIIGGFWGWYLPGNATVFDSIGISLIFFLSFYWMAFILAFRAPTRITAVARGMFSSVITFLTFFLVGISVYGYNNFINMRLWDSTYKDSYGTLLIVIITFAYLVPECAILIRELFED